MKQVFFDRTEKGNENKPLHKLLQLKNLAVYWNSNDDNQMNKNNNLNIHDMNELIMKDDI